MKPFFVLDAAEVKILLLEFFVIRSPWVYLAGQAGRKYADYNFVFVRRGIIGAFTRRPYRQIRK